MTKRTFRKCTDKNAVCKAGLGTEEELDGEATGVILYCGPVTPPWLHVEASHDRVIARDRKPHRELEDFRLNASASY